MVKRARLKMLGSSVRTVDTRTVKPIFEDRPKLADDFYTSAAWKALASKVVRERGRRCQNLRCETSFGELTRVYVDHIVEIKDGGAKLDEQNLQVLCSSCHGKKTAAERGKRARAGYAE